MQKLTLPFRLPGFCAGGHDDRPFWKW